MRAGRVKRLTGSLAGLLLALRLSPLASQAPADRLSLAALSDSLAHIADTVPLRERQSALRAAIRRHPGRDLDLVRLALVGMRLAQLGASPDLRDAIKTLRRATESRPDWPVIWYWLGVAETRRAAWEQEDRLALGNRIGLPTLERAAAWYRRALEVEPSFAAAAVALGAVTLELRDTALLARGAVALRRAAVVPNASPEVYLAWGRLERAAANPDSADAAFERYLGAGGSRPMGLLELARTGLAAGRAGAEERYYTGAMMEDPIAVAGYRADLAMIASDSELAEFDGSRQAGRREFLRRFWNDRDRREMRAEGERLREHYRRLLHARRHFGLTVSRRFYGPADAYRSGSMEIDDRGVIYVRHGEPRERLRPFVFGLMPNESWRFHRAEGDLLFHFSSGWDLNGGGDLYDYRLVESVLDLRGAEDAPRDQLLLSRQTLSNLYGRMLNWGFYGAARSRAKERGIGRASIARGTTSDSHELQFARSLQAVADLVTVGSMGSATIGHLVFAIAVPETRPEVEVGGERYPIRVRAVATDTAGRPVANMDTTIVFRPTVALRRGRYLVGRAEVLLPAGLWSWRSALQLGESLGVVLRTDTVRVTGRGPGLSLSDLALGIGGASVLWQPTVQDSVLLTPFKQFAEGGELQLYYETAGAIEAATYRHEIAVFRLKGQSGVPERRPVVTLGFDERAPGTLLRSHRVLQLERLRRGRYLIEVQVRALGGPPVARRREFQVVRAP